MNKTSVNGTQLPYHHNPHHHNYNTSDIQHSSLLQQNGLHPHHNNTIHNPHGNIQHLQQNYEQLNIVTNPNLEFIGQRSTDVLGQDNSNPGHYLGNVYDFFPDKKAYHETDLAYSQQNFSSANFYSLNQQSLDANLLDYSSDHQGSDRHFSGPSVSGGSSSLESGSVLNVFTPNNNNGSFIDEENDINDSKNAVISTIYTNNNNNSAKVIKQEMHSPNIYTSTGTTTPNSSSLESSLLLYSQTIGYDHQQQQQQQHSSGYQQPFEQVSPNIKHEVRQTKNIIPNFTSPESAFYQYQNRMEAQLCQVCGESAAGFHHGAYVCEACKKFFMRHSLTDSKLQTACPTGGKCSVTKGNRGKCQQCRFKKCLEIGMFLKDPDSQNDVDISNIPCRVCGGRSSGFHFGALTCEGCKGFFRRTEGTNARLVCVGGQDNCAITPRSRNACKSCRFKRCISVGMSKVGSRIGRQPNAVKYHCAMEIMQLQVMKNVLASSNPSPANNHSDHQLTNRFQELSENPSRNDNWTLGQQQINQDENHCVNKSLRRRAGSSLSSTSEGRSAKELRLDNDFNFSNNSGRKNDTENTDVYNPEGRVVFNQTQEDDPCNNLDHESSNQTEAFFNHILHQPEIFHNFHESQHQIDALNGHKFQEIISPQYSEDQKIELNRTILKFICSMKSAIEFIELPKEHFKTKYGLASLPINLDCCDITIWNEVMNRFEIFSQLVVHFTKLVPGFDQLSVPAKTCLLRDSIYSIILLFLSRDFNSKTYEFNFLNFTSNEISIILHNYPAFNCCAEHLKISGSFIRNLLINSTELAIFCVMELLKNYHILKPPESSDAQGLYFIAKQSLVYLINASNESSSNIKTSRISQIEGLSVMLTRMNKEHQTILTDLRKKRHDLHYPELYVEIFQLNDEKTSILNLNTLRNDGLGYCGLPSSSSANSSTSGIEIKTEDNLDDQRPSNLSNSLSEQDFISQPS